MAEQAVEKQRRDMLGGPLIVSIGVLFSLLLGMLTIMPLYGRPNYEVGLYDAHEPGVAVAVKGKRWPTREGAIRQDAAMVAVGRTDEGYLLYADVHGNYGGGGGAAPETTGDMGYYPELFVRTAKNHYVRVK